MYILMFLHILFCSSKDIFTNRYLTVNICGRWPMILLRLFTFSSQNSHRTERRSDCVHLTKIVFKRRHRQSWTLVPSTQRIVGWHWATQLILQIFYLTSKEINQSNKYIWNGYEWIDRLYKYVRCPRKCRVLHDKNCEWHPQWTSCIDIHRAK